MTSFIESVKTIWKLYIKSIFNKLNTETSIPVCLKTGIYYLQNDFFALYLELKSDNYTDLLNKLN
jgi:hypothetical protein